jgi:hypothetical protein
MVSSFVARWLEWYRSATVTAEQTTPDAYPAEGTTEQQESKLLERKETYHWRRKKRPLEERTRYIAYLPK